MQSAGVIRRYAIGGAVGATFYLEPSATLDLDIFVDLPQPTQSTLVSLAPIYDFLRNEGGEISGEYVIIAEWPVQFLIPGSSLESEAMVQAAATEVESVPTWVMTAEHLVAIALQTGRLKDHNRILQFLEWKRVNPDRLMTILERHSLVSKWNAFKDRYLREQ